MRRGKIATWITAGALGAGLLYAYWPRPLPVETDAVTRGLLEATVDGDGRTRIRERQTVSSPLTGRIDRIAVRPGDSVSAGSILTAVTPLDPPLLDARSRAQARAQLTRAEAAYEQALAREAAALAAQQYAERRYERSSTVNQGLQRATMEGLEVQARRADAELASARSGVSMAASERAGARAAMLRFGDAAGARGNARVDVRVPIDAVVLRVFRESAGPIEAGAPIVELGIPASLEAVVDLRSSDAVKAFPGAAVHLDDWGGARPLEGRVRLVEPSGFSKVSALGIEEQRVNVIIDFEASDPKRLGDGYGVHARIVTFRAEQTAKIPLGALVRYAAQPGTSAAPSGDDAPSGVEADGWAVYLVGGGRARLRPVKLGHRSREEVEVVAGIEPGDRIIVHLTDNLADGTRVTERRVTER